MNVRKFAVTTLTVVSTLAVSCSLAAAADLEKISVRLDWLAGSNHAALFAAKDKGYYKDAGLDVEILNGQGSLSTIQLVAAGNNTIGLASLSAVALAESKDIPVIGIAGIMQRGPESVIALASSGITKPKDLEGKKFGYVPSDQAQKLFDAFADVNGINKSTIKRVATSYATTFTSLINGDVDFVAAWAVPDGTKINEEKPIAPPMVFADFGINTLGTGIFVSKDTADKKGDILKRFIAATIKGEAAVEANPEVGVKLVHAANPESSEKVLAIEMKALPHFLHTDHTAGKVYGWVAPEDVAETIKVQQKFFDMKPGVNADDVYTGKFFPASN